MTSLEQATSRTALLQRVWGLLGCGVLQGCVLQGCSCSVESAVDEVDSGQEGTTSKPVGNTHDASRNTTGIDGSSVDAGRGNESTDQVDITLEQEAGSIDLAADKLDGGTDASTIDGGSTDGGLDASSIDAMVGCTSVFSTCRDGAIHTCAALGELEQTFECSNGCDPETAECLTLQLNTWSVHQFALTDDSIRTEANYTFEEDGLVAVQTANPMPSAYLNNVVVSNFVARGKVSVATSSDDDMFGFVFGWQDPQHFYLVDWKQATQDAPPCGLAPVGVGLKLVNSDTPLESCFDFWSGIGSEKVEPLLSPAGPGWVENTVYDFELVFRPGDIQLKIRNGDDVVVDLESDDKTYTSGLFGFYNYSQEGVRYEFFTLEPGF
jgi:hypothetical protein